MAYLYRHIRVDKNEPFYIGIGECNNNKGNIYKRAYNRSRRNSHWKNIVSKTDYIVEIIFDNLSWEEACEKEKWWINFYGRSDLGNGPLCNLTDGGEGIIGYSPTQETRRKISKAGTGRKMDKSIYTEDHRYILGSSFRNKNLTEEHREKIRIAAKKRYSK